MSLRLLIVVGCYCFLLSWFKPLIDARLHSLNLTLVLTLVRPYQEKVQRVHDKWWPSLIFNSLKFNVDKCWLFWDIAIVKGVCVHVFVLGKYTHTHTHNKTLVSDLLKATIKSFFLMLILVFLISIPVILFEAGCLASLPIVEVVQHIIYSVPLDIYWEHISGKLCIAHSQYIIYHYNKLFGAWESIFYLCSP